MIVSHSRVACGASNDVVGEHAFDVKVLLLRLLREVGRAQQALLFASDRHKYYRRVEIVMRHGARHLQDSRRARSVIVRSGRVTLCVSWARAHRIVMAAHDVEPVRRFCLSPFERSDYVRKHGGLRHATARRGQRLLQVGLLLYGHAPAGLSRYLLKFRVEPVTRRAYAARRVVLSRQRVARSERDELAYGSLYVPR